MANKTGFEKPAFWHTFSGEQALQTLESHSDGMSQTEALRRQQIYGPNQLTAARQKSLFMRLFKHFNNILIYVLLASALITLFLDHLMDSMVILAVVIAMPLTNAFLVSHYTHDTFPD